MNRRPAGAPGWLALPFVVLPLRAQEPPECAHGPASAVPVGVTQTFNYPFGDVARAASNALKGMWYQIDSSAIETAPPDSGGGKRGYWRTRRSTHWPAELDRSPWRGHPHPGLIVTLTLTQRGDTVVARYGARVLCAAGVPDLDARGGPIDQLQTRASLEISTRLRREVTDRYRR